MNPTDPGDLMAVPLLGSARAATTMAHHLGEGPVWDPIRARILWVDILAGMVFSGTLTDAGDIVVQECVAFPDVAAAVAVSAAGEWIVAGSHRLHTRRTEGAIESGALLFEGEGRRFNDGKPDPVGRFVVGTKGPAAEGGGAERLLQISPDDQVRTLDEDLSLSNGLAWTCDGRTMYSVDTLTRRIHARDYDPLSGDVGERRLLIEITDGLPDGMTIDREDHLWVALWGAGMVVRISPAGEIVGRVSVPAPQVSCPVFAGPDLDVLVITTATEGMTPDRLAAAPLSGRLFTVRTEHRGAPPNLWAGSPRTTPDTKESA